MCTTGSGRGKSQDFSANTIPVSFKLPSERLLSSRLPCNYDVQQDSRWGRGEAVVSRTSSGFSFPTFPTSVNRKSRINMQRALSSLSLAPPLFLQASGAPVSISVVLSYFVDYTGRHRGSCLTKQTPSCPPVNSGIGFLMSPRTRSQLVFLFPAILPLLQLLYPW
jgi:hypothetical protein